MKRLLSLAAGLLLLLALDPGCARQIRVSVETVEDLQNYSEGLAAYREGGKWGFMTLRGYQAVTSQFAEVRPFSQGLAAMKLVNKWGFIDRSGKYAVNPQFQEAGDFSESMAPVKKDGKWGYINPEGKFLIECQFDEARPFSEKLAAVSIGGRWGFINRKGSLVINPRFAGAGNFHIGLAPVKTDRKDDPWEYIDHEGRMRIKPQYDDARDFSPEAGLAPVLIDTRWAQISKSGRIVINPRFEDTRSFRHGLAAAKTGGKWGYLNTRGAWAIAARFDSASDFLDELALVVEKGRKYYIDRSGRPAGIGRRIVGDIKPEADFIEIEPVSFSFQNEGPTLRYTSSRARIFYSFHPADEKALEKPLFVFFNGGPGAGTSDGLLSFNTSPKTLDPKIAGLRMVADNPHSWTRMANLLYMDAPCTGFSYNLLGGSVSKSAFLKEFDAQNFNPFIDAAQLVRALLRFLAKHPELRKNPVVLVGESYGGTRTTTMLNLLLFYPGYGSGKKVYRDRALATEIQKHYEAVFPEGAGKPYPPEAAARQFGRHILIEPQLTGSYQSQVTGEMWEKEGSVLDRLAREKGIAYHRCDPKDSKCDPMENGIKFLLTKAFRDMYKYDESATWSWLLGYRAQEILSHTDYLSHITETNIADTKNFYAKNRKNAYKGYPGWSFLWDWFKGLFIRDKGGKTSPYGKMHPALRAYLSNLPGIQKTASLNPPAALNHPGPLLSVTFGRLGYYDSYITRLSMNWMAFAAFTGNSAMKKGYAIHPESPRYGRLFLQNIAVAKAFITNAPYDMSIFAEALPPSFKKYEDIVRDVRVQDETITLSYKPSSLKEVKTPDSVNVPFPYYRDAGHMVAISMPDKLLKDVMKWMEE